MLRSTVSIRPWLSLLLLSACAHCGDSSGGSAIDADAAATDANVADASGADAAVDAGTHDANGDQEAGTHDAATDAAQNEGDAMTPLPQHTYVYVVGGYGANTFRAYEIDRSSLALKSVQHNAQAGDSPTYICPSKDGRHLYLANEHDGQPGLTVLRVDSATGVPSKVDSADAVEAKGYVFTALDPAGKHVVAASYNGGFVGVHRIESDGTLGALTGSAPFFGGDPTPQTHSIRVHPSGKWAYVPNKGRDEVAQFTYDADAGKIEPIGSTQRFTRAGFNGPRHIAFSPDGKLAFVILELADEIVSFSVESNGTLRELDKKPRLPSTYTGNDTGAHVLVHPQGKFVYGSNRGSNTIAVFSYDAQGKMTLLEHESTRGQTPRNFDIDPYGQFMVVANQGKDGSGASLAVFSIEADGRLSPRGDVVTGVGAPAAVAIVGF